MSAREEFCRLVEAGGVSVRELCRRFSISPTTGYKWLARWSAQGRQGLADLSRRPQSSPTRTGAEIEAEVLKVREFHWGGRKIRQRLIDDGFLNVPAASTITEILRRHGKLDGPKANEPRSWNRFERAEPNDLWQIDFKGHVPLVDGGRLHPLTVLDDFSRFSMVLAACGNQQDATVRGHLTEAFRRYGLPWRMLSDNGSPWGSAGGELTAFAVWLMDLDVRLIHRRPYLPQTQGKDERFHRTLKAEVLAHRTFANFAEAEVAFAVWREVYNTLRPHEALGLQVPARRYRASPRPFPEKIEPPEYEAQTQIRTVGHTGQISFANRRHLCPKALIGRRVALRATDTDGIYDLCYRRHVISQIDLRDHVSQTVHHVPEHVSTMSPA